MRIIEIFLVCAVLLGLLAWLAGWQKLRLSGSIAVYISAVLLFVQWLVEGQRWQLWPVYLVTCLMLVTQLAADFRHKDISKSLLGRKRLWRVSIVLTGFLLTAMGTILASVLPIFDLPEPTGSYKIGTTRLHFTDYNRPDNYSAIQNDYRQVPVRIWYPSLDRGGTMAPYMTPAESGALATTYGLPPFFLSYLSLVETPSVMNARAAEGQFPLILYSPSGFEAQSTAMCEELASHGYIVAVINHAYWNAYTWDSIGTLVVSDRGNTHFRQMWREELAEKTEQLKGQITRASDFDRKLQLHAELNKSMPTEVEDIREWSKDISFVIDQFDKQKTGSVEFAKAMDLSKVGVIGFSKGGAAAGQMCIDDRRIDAGVNLDGFMFGDIVNYSIPCAFMFVHSEPFLSDAYINDVFYENAPDKSVMLKVRGTKHANFSDMSLWGSLMTAQDNFGSINGNRVTKIINAYVLAFFNSTLNGTVEPLLTCPRGEYPEVEIFKKAGLSKIKITPLSGAYLGQEPAGLEPELFAPGVIPVDGIQHCFPSFTPDGKEAYWTSGGFVENRFKSSIWYTQEEDGRWGNPRIAPFSGEYDDHAPFVSADGNRLYFSSSRPGGYGNAKNIWYVNRTDDGWSEPFNLGSPPNSDRGATQATFTDNGTVYFVARMEGTQWNTGIYRSRFENGEYMEPEALPPPISTEYADVYPFIAHDESYLLFGSSRPGGRSPETDLYISFRNSDDTWTEPLLLDDSINNGKTVSFSSVTHDRKYLFFNRFDSDGTDKFYWVDISLLKDRRTPLIAVPEHELNSDYWSDR